MKTDPLFLSALATVLLLAAAALWAECRPQPAPVIQAQAPLHAALARYAVDPARDWL